MKKLIIILFMLIGWMSGSGQNFIRLADQSGYTFPSEANTDLEQLATEIVNALPAEFRPQFKVYDFGYYVINEFMVGQNDEPAIWQSVVSDAKSRSPYYLLFGREFNQNGVFNTLRVTIKLPSTGIFTCVDASYLTIIENAVTLPSSAIVSQLGSTLGFAGASVMAEKGAMTSLKGHLNKISTCCINGTWSPSCGTCRYSGFEAESFYLSKGFMKLGASGITITDHTYGSINSKIKITFTAQGEFVNFTDELNGLAAESGAKIRVKEINSTNCDSVSAYQPLTGSGSFVEDIVVINIDGHKVVMSKIQIDKSARFVPVWVIAEILKRLGTATTAAAIEVGVNVLLEWWIGGHSTFMQAWDATEIDWVEVLGAFAEGAVSEAKYASFIINALKPVVKWIISTPYSAYFDDGKGSGSRGPGWIAALGTQITQSFASTAMEEFVFKKVEVIKKVAIKYSNKLPAAMKAKLPKVVYAIAIKNSKLIRQKRWKEIVDVLENFSPDSDLIENPIYLEKVMDAMKISKYKIKGQKLGRNGNSTTLGDNIEKATGQKRPANFASHHMVPSTDPRGKKARDLLKENGIDINEGVQGVYLPQGSKYVDNGQANHKTIHTDAYYTNLTNMLLPYKGNPSGMRDELLKIKQLLLSNQFPH